MSDDPFGICLEPECHDDEEVNELPSVLQMAKNLAGSARDIAVGALKGEGIKVDDTTYEYRMSICGGCEFFISETERCSVCGCYMKAKNMFKKTYCPEGKWGAVE
jgi:hypothetical protein